MPRVPDKDILIYIYIYYITVCIVQVNIILKTVSK